MGRKQVSRASLSRGAVEFLSLMWRGLANAECGGLVIQIPSLVITPWEFNEAGLASPLALDSGVLTLEAITEI